MVCKSTADPRSPYRWLPYMTPLPLVCSVILRPFLSAPPPPSIRCQSEPFSDPLTRSGLSRMDTVGERATFFFPILFPVRARLPVDVDVDLARSP